eukprot:jgi/Chrzof1/4004/Cz13g16230.t1
MTTIPVQIRPLFSQTCTARIQKFPDGSGSPQMFPDVSRCFQMCPEVSRGVDVSRILPESHRGPTLKHRPQHRAEDTESLVLKYGLHSVRPALPESRSFQMVLEVPRCF